MQYPGTIDNWIDQSGIQAQEAADITPRPLMLAAAAFDRGPEKFTRVYGADFYKLYGYYIDYEKYGQAAIQCANIINNGGELLLKRVVAEDATLANIVVVAKVTSSRVQKTDADGNPLYVDPVSGKETTSAGDNNEKVMIIVASIKYELVTVTGKKTLDEVVEEATRSFVQDDETQTFTYPIMVIVDNGRGESTKRFNIIPQYQISKTQNFMLYKFKYLGSEDLDAESVYFSVVPGVMYLNKSMAIEMACTEMLQCRAKSIEKSIDAFYNKVAEITGFDLDELHKYDLLFGKDNKGNAVQGISYDDNGIDLSAEIGFGLESGSNGAFGDTPILTDEYEKALKDVFDGTFDEDIYNLDLYKIDACVDANYPYEVKKAIYELAKFRKDFFFFGDLGLEVETFSDAQNKMYEMPRDKFTGWYGQSYQILNPFTKRNIDVTITYSIARKVITQQENRTHTTN